MKRLFLTGVLAAFVFFQMGLGSGTVFAAPEDEGLFKRKASKTDEEARNALRKRIMEKKDELNGSAWKIEIKSQSGKGEYLGPDTLTFQNEKFRSAMGEKYGYSSTNYTLTVQESEEGPTIWETMQTSKEGEITFWRGEWKEDAMSGVISRQLKDTNEDYYFSSSGRETVPKTVEQEDSEEATANTSASLTAVEEPAAVAPVLGGAAVPSPEKSAKTEQKKSGWFF